MVNCLITGAKTVVSRYRWTRANHMKLWAQYSSKANITISQKKRENQTHLDNDKIIKI